MDVDAEGESDPDCDTAADNGPEGDGEVEAPTQEDKTHSPTVDIEVTIVQSFKQDLGPWFFAVRTAALHNDKTIGRCDAVLIKRECVIYPENDSTTFLEAIRGEDEGLTILFDSPPLLHKKRGRVILAYLRLVKDFFPSSDYKYYRASQGKDEQGKDLRVHPANRAWLLLFRNIEVDRKYRRRGVAGGMVRNTLTKVCSLAEQADRPLFVAVQPGSPDNFPPEVWRHKPLEIIYKGRIAETFWRSLGFIHYKGPRLRYNWPWLF